MKTKLLDLIDFERLNVLLESFNRTTGFVTAILDGDGNILSKSGWSRACTEFHRKYPETSVKCRQSDTVLAGKFKDSELYHCYRCLNGLIDVAVPIKVKGEHIANLFSGQFFLEKPDMEFFRKQAEKYGFNVPDYLQAISDIPVISEENVKDTMDFLLNMTELISHMALQKLELLELNEALRTSEEKYRLVLENSMDAIMLTSPDGGVLTANPAACNMFQRSEEEIQRVGRKGLTVPEDPRLPELLTKRDATGKAKGEILMIRKDGTRFPVEMSTSIYYDNSGNKRSSMIIHDITERKKAEEQLIIAKEKAEEGDRLKTAFLQNLSHEIRTPMNAIIGFSGLLRDHYNDKEKLEQYAGIITQRCNDLLDVINDILDIAKIESGQLNVNNEECNIAELFRDLSSSFAGYQSRIGKQQISLKVKLPELPDDFTVFTDTIKLKQIIINLISNAFKFTDEGIIEIGCRLLDDHHLAIYVSDTGIGIPEDKLSFIFERFTQLNNATRKYIGGTGLGLSIVKGLVGLLGGDITVCSQVGKGSTFTFTIPCKAKHQHEEPDFTK